MKERILILFNDTKNRILILGFVLIGVAFVFSNLQTNAKPELESIDPTSADTIIPKGFVLVPVEIQNIDSLSSLVGSFALVDLFTTAQIQQKGGTRVGRRLRLMRAPLNPQSFAVLVPESQAHEILSAQGPFSAVIQNPEYSAPMELNKHQNHISRIEYFKGGSYEKK